MLTMPPAMNRHPYANAVKRTNRPRRLNSFPCDWDSIRLANISLAPPRCRCRRVKEAVGLDNEAADVVPDTVQKPDRQGGCSLSWRSHKNDAVTCRHPP